MSRHVAPHRWADAFAGKLDERELGKMERHAEGCGKCARARSRVISASQSFPALRAQSAPDLAWDSIRARVHWSVSKERRTQKTTSRTRIFPWLAAGAAAGIGAIALALAISSSSSPTPQVAEAPAPAVAVAPKPAPTPLGALVVREIGQRVMVDGVLREHAFDDVLGPGSALATGAGRVDVQFDEHSALSLGPSTIVSFKRFDSERIELVLKEGSLDVTVGKRAADQRFLVLLGSEHGGRTVEVRGTHFRVTEEAGAARVECAHGKVSVRDAASEIDVDGSRKIELAPRALVGNTKVTELSKSEIASLEATTPLRLPVWTSPEQLVQTSAPLEVATTGARDVRVDGVEVGQGPLRLRVMPGRHTVETADDAGRFRRAGWVDVAAAKPARLAVLPDAPASSTGGEVVRRKQFKTGIDRARLALCTRSITKAGVTDTYVRIEIAIDETGAVGFLNVIDTDLPSATAGCVREVLADVRFKAGPSATFREKLDL